MGFFKVLSRGMYYRIRRVAKALRNWRKFGVIMFGSLFIAGSLSLPTAVAEGLYQVAIYPTHSEITLGQSKLYTAQAFMGTQKVTDESVITWLVSKGSTTLTSATGSSFTYTPSEVGTYTIKAKGEHTSGAIAWNNSPATLVVTGGGPEPGPAAHYQVAIYPTYSEITLGHDKLYTAQAFLGTDNVTSQSDITWVVSQGSTSITTATGSQFDYTPSAAGTYTVKARGEMGSNIAWNNDPATLVVSGITPPPPVNQPPVANLIATPPSGNVPLNSVLNASGSFDPDGSIVSYNWDRDGNGSYDLTTVVPTTNWTYSTVGTYIVKVRVVDNHGATDTATATITTTQAPVTPTDYIDVVITPHTQTIYSIAGSAVYTARVYDRFGTNVTSSSSVLWSLPNSSAGYIESQTNYGSYSQVVVRAGSVLGSFPVRVQAWYSTLYDWDEASMTVAYPPVPPTPSYWITASLHGVIEDGSTPSKGDVIVYTLDVANYQSTTVHNVWVDMPVPANTTFLSTYSTVDDPYISGGTVHWNVGTIYGGQIKIMTVRVQIPESLVGSAVIQTYARITASEISGFNVYSNKIYVGGTGGGGNLVPTGIDIEILTMIAVLSLALSVMGYAFLNRREIMAKLQG